MAWRFTGKARVDAGAPSAFGVCDRCGFLYNLVDLAFQHDFRGNQLINLWLRVCPKCMDKPQNQLRPKSTPPDPIPVYQPRPENYTAADQGVSAATLGTPPQIVPEP
jgi:hypothetical protein